MKDEILKILESYITDGYRTERGIYDNDIDDVADELVKLFTIRNVSKPLRDDFGKPPKTDAEWDKMSNRIANEEIKKL